MAKILDIPKIIWDKAKGWIIGLSSIANIVLLSVLASTGGDSQLAQDILDDAEQRIIEGDSIMIITATRDSLGETVSRDTLVRAVQEADLNTGMFRLKDTTADGYTIYKVTIGSINLLTKKDSTHYIFASRPPIGTQWNLKIRQSKTEIAEEKIPEKLEQLVVKTGSDSACLAIGWQAVKDTVETAVKDSVYLSKRWCTDGVAVRVKYVAEPVEEPIGEVVP